VYTLSNPERNVAINDRDGAERHGNAKKQTDLSIPGHSVKDVKSSSHVIHIPDANVDLFDTFAMSRFRGVYTPWELKIRKPSVEYLVDTFMRPIKNLASVCMSRDDPIQ
jgi:hypothetical protein